MNYRVVKLPYVSVNTRHSPRCQVEFQLIGDGWTLGKYPMEKVREIDKFRGYMSNPKVFRDEPGEFRRNLGFAEKMDKLPDPDLTELRLGFRVVDLGDDAQWTIFPIPGVYDSRNPQETISS